MKRESECESLELYEGIRFGISFTLQPHEVVYCLQCLHLEKILIK